MKTKFIILQFLFVLFLSSGYAQDSISVMDDMKSFEQSIGKKQIASANSFLSKLYKQEFIDKLERYDAHTPFDTICKHVYFRATEFAFYELVDYEQTLYYGNKALEVMQRCEEVALEGSRLQRLQSALVRLVVALVPRRSVRTTALRIA